MPGTQCVHNSFYTTDGNWVTANKSRSTSLSNVLLWGIFLLTYCVPVPFWLATQMFYWYLTPLRNFLLKDSPGLFNMPGSSTYHEELFELVNYNHVSFFRHDKHTNMQHTNITSNYQHPKIPSPHPVKWFIQSLGLMKGEESLKCTVGCLFYCVSSRYSIKRAQRHSDSLQNQGD